MSDIQPRMGMLSSVPYPHLPGLSWTLPSLFPSACQKHGFLQGELCYHQVLQELPKEGFVGIMTSLLASEASPTLFCPRPERGVLETPVLGAECGRKKATAFPGSGQVSTYYLTLGAASTSKIV